MDLVATTSEQAETIVAVLGAVATARGTQEPSGADRAVIEVAAAHLLGGATVPEDLAGSIPGVVAERLADPVVRELVLVIATILCFAEGPEPDDDPPDALEPSRVAVVDDLARYLRASTLEVVELRRLARDQRELVAHDLSRRFVTSTAPDPMLRSAVDGTETRLHIDARRVHALWERIERLGDGTVGAELVRYYRENGWSYPGTDHRQPLTFAEHDFHHVLAGYATTASGELQLGAFTAGAAERPMDAARCLLTWAQLGSGGTARIRPVHAFDSAAFDLALERGAQTTRDFVGAGWDPWAIVDRHLDEVRLRHRIGDGAQLAAGEPYDRDPVRTRH